MTDKRKVLTTLEAANIGRAMGVRGLIVHRDPTDRTLWQVVAPGRVETHEPMDEAAWREFLTASGWIDGPKLYDAGNGRKVTVPENEDPADAGKELRDLLQDCMSPHAVAAIVAFLQPVRTNDPNVDRQVHWFSERLIELLGGGEAQSQLAEELGL